jgi:hypothetical protein
MRGGSLGSVLAPDDIRTDLLDANEGQEGQCGSSRQVRTAMAGDRGHLRAMRLLPFAAAGQGTHRRPGWFGCPVLDQLRQAAHLMT